MTFVTRKVPCPCCNRGRMEAELDQANKLWLACKDEKCGARLRDAAVVQMVAEREARESNRVKAVEHVDRALEVVSGGPGDAKKLT